MHLNSQDWKKLQVPLLILGTILLLIVVLFVWATDYRKKQEAALHTQQGLLNAAKQHFQSSGIEKEMIAEYLPQYQALISQGLVGEERRIEWVEALRAEHKNHKLFGIKYSISQQENYKPPFIPNLGTFILHRSTMKLDLDMLHEGDILQLVESLNEKNVAPFMLRNCAMTRLGAAKSGSVVALSNQLNANMHAQCEIDWLTLREPIVAAGLANQI